MAGAIGGALACAIVPLTNVAAQSALVDTGLGEPAVALGESGSAQIAAPAMITIGPEAVGASSPVYAIRSQGGTSGLTVTFSDHPPIAAPASDARDVLGESMPAGWPVAGVITSGYGARVHPLSGTWRQHRGIDLAAREGTPIRATAAGVVGTAGWAGAYGLLVSLEHAGGVQTRYAHMSRLNVGSGQHVKAGDIIGFVGSTGNSTGPHVHYEVRRNGRALNPLAG